VDENDLFVNCGLFLESNLWSEQSYCVKLAESCVNNASLLVIDFIKVTF